MRTFISLLSVVLFASVTLIASGQTIVVIQPFDNAALAVNSTNYSPAVDLNYYQPWDFTYALQVQCTNLTSTNACGIVALSYELSNNNVDYLASSNIVTGLSFTNSPTSGGKGFYQFDAGKSRYIRFKAIVTQTNCWFSGWLAIQ